MRSAARRLCSRHCACPQRHAVSQATLRVINEAPSLIVESREAAEPSCTSTCCPSGFGFRQQRSFASSQPVAPEQAACWNCQAGERTADTLFCASCGAVMPLEASQNYFFLMSLKDGDYSIDDSTLDRQYKHLQRQLHPDKFSNKPEQERDLSAEASSLVNEAFSTLKSPLKRGEYLLKLRGIEAGEGTIEDPEMLTIIMEAREAIEATSDQDELRNFASVFQQQSSDCIQGIQEAFQKDDMQKAQDLVTTLKYVTNIQAAILEKL